MSITPPKPKDDLVAAAALLSRAAPVRWSEFIKAFEAYMQERKDLCVQAPSDKVLLTQGRARECVELSSLFTEAMKTK